jgi:hypothetical protein
VQKAGALFADARKDLTDFARLESGEARQQALQMVHKVDLLAGEVERKPGETAVAFRTRLDLIRLEASDLEGTILALGNFAQGAARQDIDNAVARLRQASNELRTDIDTIEDKLESRPEKSQPLVPVPPSGLR